MNICNVLYGISVKYIPARRSISHCHKALQQFLERIHYFFSFLSLMNVFFLLMAAEEICHFTSD